MHWNCSTHRAGTWAKLSRNEWWHKGKIGLVVNMSMAIIQLNVQCESKKSPPEVI